MNLSKSLDQDNAPVSALLLPDMQHSGATAAEEEVLLVKPTTQVDVSNMIRSSSNCPWDHQKAVSSSCVNEKRVKIVEKAKSSSTSCSSPLKRKFEEPLVPCLSSQPTISTTEKKRRRLSLQFFAEQGLCAPSLSSSSSSSSDATATPAAVAGEEATATAIKKREARRVQFSQQPPEERVWENPEEGLNEQEIQQLRSKLYFTNEEYAAFIKDRINTLRVWRSIGSSRRRRTTRRSSSAAAQNSSSSSADAGSASTTCRFRANRLDEHYSIRGFEAYSSKETLEELHTQRWMHQQTVFLEQAKQRQEQQHQHPWMMHHHQALSRSSLLLGGGAEHQTSAAASKMILWDADRMLLKVERLSNWASARARRLAHQDALECGTATQSCLEQLRLDTTTNGSGNGSPKSSSQAPPPPPPTSATSNPSSASLKPSYSTSCLKDMRRKTLHVMHQTTTAPRRFSFTHGQNATLPQHDNCGMDLMQSSSSGAGLSSSEFPGVDLGHLRQMNINLLRQVLHRRQEQMHHQHNHQHRQHHQHEQQQEHETSMAASASLARHRESRMAAEATGGSLSITEEKDQSADCGIISDSPTMSLHALLKHARARNSARRGANGGAAGHSSSHEDDLDEEGHGSSNSSHPPAEMKQSALSPTQQTHQGVAASLMHQHHHRRHNHHQQHTTSTTTASTTTPPPLQQQHRQILPYAIPHSAFSVLQRARALGPVDSLTNLQAARAAHHDYDEQASSPADMHNQEFTFVPPQQRQPMHFANSHLGMQSHNQHHFHHHNHPTHRHNNLLLQRSLQASSSGSSNNNSSSQDPDNNNNNSTSAAGSVTGMQRPIVAGGRSGLHQLLETETEHLGI